jgi:hypothetical protein
VSGAGQVADGYSATDRQCRFVDYVGATMAREVNTEQPAASLFRNHLDSPGSMACYLGLGYCRHRHGVGHHSIARFPGGFFAVADDSDLRVGENGHGK